MKPLPRRQFVAQLVIVVVLRLVVGDVSADAPIGLAFIGAIVGAIGAALGWLGQQAVTFAVMAAQVAVWIGLAIADFAIIVAGVFVKVWGLLRSFWGGVLKPFVSWSWTQLERIHAWLKRTLGPVLKVLETVRRHVRELYDKWLRPIFDTIEITRRTLQLLAQLRIPWARELDAKLAQLETRLLAPVRRLYALLNEAMDWINRIIDMNGVFQRATLIRSLWRYQGDALKVWWTSVHKPLTAAKDAEYRQPLATRSVAAVAAELRTYFEGGDGPNSARIEEHALDLSIRLRRVPRL